MGAGFGQVCDEYAIELGSSTHSTNNLTSQSNKAGDRLRIAIGKGATV
jgi:hypothetical protein